MFLRLLLLLTVVPLVELMILLRLAELLKWPTTLAIVILTGVIGAWLARREGIKALNRVREDLANGIPPADAVVDGILILVAGIFLVTPGVLTDACGFAMLVPPIRRWVRRRLTEFFRRKIVVLHPNEPSLFVDVDVVDTTTHSEDSASSPPGESSPPRE